MKITVGRCPRSGAALASQSAISRLENAPSKSEAARLCAALVGQFGETTIVSKARQGMWQWPSADKRRPLFLEISHPRTGARRSSPIPA
jgi:hypothetical protein